MPDVAVDVPNVDPFIFATVTELLPADDDKSPVNAGNLPAGNVPELILDAFVVSVVADAEKELPFVFVTVILPEDEIVASPDIACVTH